MITEEIVIYRRPDDLTTCDVDTGEPPTLTPEEYRQRYGFELNEIYNVL